MMRIHPTSNGDEGREGGEDSGQMVVGTGVTMDYSAVDDPSLDVVVRGVMRHAVLNTKSVVVTGRFHGIIEAKSLELSKGALLLGKAVVRSAVVAGRLEGILLVGDMLTMRSSGHCDGVLRYGQLNVQHGGKLTGAVKAASSADVGIGDMPVPDLPPGTWDDFLTGGRGKRGGSEDLSLSASIAMSASLRSMDRRLAAENTSRRVAEAAAGSDERLWTTTGTGQKPAAAASATQRTEEPPAASSGASACAGPSLGASASISGAHGASGVVPEAEVTAAAGNGDGLVATRPEERAGTRSEVSPDEQAAAACGRVPLAGRADEKPAASTSATTAPAMEAVESPLSGPGVPYGMMSPTSHLVFGSGRNDGVLSPPTVVSTAPGGAWGAPRDPPAVDGRSPEGSETAEIDLLDFLHEAGQQRLRLRDEATEEVHTEALSSLGTPVSATGSTESVSSPFRRGLGVGVASDHVGNASSSSQRCQEEEKKILRVRKTAQESAAAAPGAAAAFREDHVDSVATLPARDDGEAAAPTVGRAEPRLLTSAWKRRNQDRSKQPQPQPAKTAAERLKDIEDAKAALRTRVALRKAAAHKGLTMEQRKSEGRRPLSLNAKSGIGARASAKASDSAEDSATSARRPSSLTRRDVLGFDATHPAYSGHPPAPPPPPPQQQQQQHHRVGSTDEGGGGVASEDRGRGANENGREVCPEPAVSRGGGVAKSGDVTRGLRGVYDDHESDVGGGTDAATVSDPAGVVEGLGSSNGADNRAAAGGSKGKAMTEADAAAAAAAMALEAGVMSLYGGGVVALASPGEDADASAKSSGGLLMNATRARVRVSGSYTEAAAAAVAAANAAAATSAASSSRKAISATLPLPHRGSRGGSRIPGSSSFDGFSAAAKKPWDGLDRSLLPMSPTPKTRPVSEEAAAASGSWVVVDVRTVAAAAAPAAGGNGGKKHAKHARSRSSDFAWSKVGTFPFLEKRDMSPASSKPMSPLVRPRPASGFPAGSTSGGIEFRGGGGGGGGGGGSVSGGGNGTSGTAGASLGGGGGGGSVLGVADIDNVGGLGDGNAPVSPIVRMPAEEFSARALGGFFGAKSQEEVEADEVWNQGSLALNREDTVSPEPPLPLRLFPPAAGNVSDHRGNGDGRSAQSTAGWDARETKSASRPSPAVEAAAATDRGEPGGGSSGHARAAPKRSWREIRDKALAANGGSFTSARRSAPELPSRPSRAAPKVEFQRSALPTLGQLRRSMSPPSPAVVGAKMATSTGTTDSSSGGGGSGSVGVGDASSTVGNPEEDQGLLEAKRRDVAEKKAIALKAVAARDLATRRATEAARAAAAAVSNAEALAAALAVAAGEREGSASPVLLELAAETRTAAKAADTPSCLSDGVASAAAAAAAAEEEEEASPLVARADSAAATAPLPGASSKLTVNEQQPKGARGDVEAVCADDVDGGRGVASTVDQEHSETGGLNDDGGNTGELVAWAGASSMDPTVVTGAGGAAADEETRSRMASSAPRRVEPAVGILPSRGGAAATRAQGPVAPTPCPVPITVSARAEESDGTARKATSTVASVEEGEALAAVAEPPATQGETIVSTTRATATTAVATVTSASAEIAKTAGSSKEHPQIEAAAAVTLVVDVDDDVVAGTSSTDTADPQGGEAEPIAERRSLSSSPSSTPRILFGGRDFRAWKMAPGVGAGRLGGRRELPVVSGVGAGGGFGAEGVSPEGSPSLPRIRSEGILTSTGSMKTGFAGRQRLLVAGRPSKERSGFVAANTVKKGLGPAGAFAGNSNWRVDASRPKEESVADVKGDGHGGFHNPMAAMRAQQQTRRGRAGSEDSQTAKTPFGAGVQEEVGAIAAPLAIPAWMLSKGVSGALRSPSNRGGLLNRTLPANARGSPVRVGSAGGGGGAFLSRASVGRPLLSSYSAASSPDRPGTAAVPAATVVSATPAEVADKEEEKASACDAAAPAAAAAASATTAAATPTDTAQGDETEAGSARRVEPSEGGNVAVEAGAACARSLATEVEPQGNDEDEDGACLMEDEGEGAGVSTETGSLVPSESATKGLASEGSACTAEPTAGGLQALGQFLFGKRSEGGRPVADAAPTGAAAAVTAEGGGNPSESAEAGTPVPEAGTAAGVVGSRKPHEPTAGQAGEPSLGLAAAAAVATAKRGASSPSCSLPAGIVGGETRAATADDGGDMDSALSNAAGGCAGDCGDVAEEEAVLAVSSPVGLVGVVDGDESAVAAAAPVTTALSGADVSAGTSATTEDDGAAADGALDPPIAAPEATIVSETSPQQRDPPIAAPEATIVSETSPQQRDDDEAEKMCIEGQKSAGKEDSSTAAAPAAVVVAVVVAERFPDATVSDTATKTTSNTEPGSSSNSPTFSSTSSVSAASSSSLLLRGRKGPRSASGIIRAGDSSASRSGSAAGGVGGGSPFSLRSGSKGFLAKGASLLSGERKTGLAALGSTSTSTKTVRRALLEETKQRRASEVKPRQGIFETLRQRSSGILSEQHATSTSSRLGASRNGNSGSGSMKRGRSPTVPTETAGEDSPPGVAGGGLGGNSAAIGGGERQHRKSSIVSSHKQSDKEGERKERPSGPTTGAGGLLEGIDDVEEVEDDEADSDDDEEPDYWSKYGIIDTDALDEDAEIEI